MFMTKKTANRRMAFTLVELLVAVAIILAIAALAAAFAPRVSDSNKINRAVDSLEQWLLSAKMRAKRDGLATGLRFIPDPNPAYAGLYFQVQYIQQPPPLHGGWDSTTPTTGSVPDPYAGPGHFLNGGRLVSASNGVVNFFNVDFSLGGTPSPLEWLVQPGDYLEVNNGSLYCIGLVNPSAPPVTSFTLLNAAVAGSYDQSLTIPAPGTLNYQIYRQPRIFIGEEPLELPNNFAVDTRIIPGPACTIPPIPANAIIPNNTTLGWSNMGSGLRGYKEILFAPSGAVVGTNAGNNIIWMTVYDTTMEPFDINQVGIVAVQARTGFIGAYSAAAGTGLPGYNPFLLVQSGRVSGL